MESASSVTSRFCGPHEHPPRAVAAVLVVLGALAGACLETAAPPAPVVLRVTSTVLPARVSSSGYLDARASALERAFRLEVGAGTTPATVRYDVVTRTVAVAPAQPLAPGVRLRLAVNPELIVGVGGAPVRGFSPTEVQSGAQGPLEPPLRYADVEPLLEGCTCHGAATPLGALDREALLSASAQRPDRALVVPGHSARSYLIEKLLDDYTDRFGTQMPPPWSAESISPGEVLRLARWIDDGARP